MSSKNQIVVNTDGFTEADLEEFFLVLDDIQQRWKEHLQDAPNSPQPQLAKALMTRYEIIDTVAISDKDETLAKANATVHSDKVLDEQQILHPKENLTVKDKTKYKSPKMRQKLPKYLVTLPSPKPSPLVKRRSSKKSSPSTIINDEQFQGLTVKDKAAYFEKTKNHFQIQTSHIEDADNTNNVCDSRLPGKKSYVKHLRDLWEARLNPIKKAVGSLQRQHKKTNKSLNTNSSKESTKQPSTMPFKWRKMLEMKYLKDEQANSELKPKRNYHILRSTLLTNEYLAPPKKIRRLDSLAIMLKDNPKLERLLYPWLLKKVDLDGEPIREMHHAGESNETSISINELESKLKECLLSDSTHTSEIKEAADTRFPLSSNKGSTKVSFDFDADTSNLNATNASDQTSTEEYPESRSSKEEYTINTKPINTNRRKKSCRCLNGKDNDDCINFDMKLYWSTDSDAETKASHLTTSSSKLNPNRKFVNKCLKHKQLHDKSLNELSFMEWDKSLMRDMNSPTKVKSTYTLTAMSTPTSTVQNVESDADEWLRTPEKMNISKSSPSILEALHLDFNMNLKTPKLNRDSLVDQGFETASNSTKSSNRNNETLSSYIIQPEERSSYEMNKENVYGLVQKRSTRCSTPHNNSGGLYPQYSLPHNVSPIKPSNMYTPRHSLTMDIIEENMISENHKMNYNTSEFWISFGHYTLSAKINHCPWERLLILRKLFDSVHTTENEAVNFGVNKEIFPLHNKSSSFTKQLMQYLSSYSSENYSEYWFCKGDVWIPFRGPFMTTAKVHRFFKHLQELKEDADGGRLSYGIDKFVFFTGMLQLNNLSKQN